MFYKEVQLHNVSQMVYDPSTNAFALLRLPEWCETTMLSQGKTMNRCSIGVELRFQFEEEITFILRSKTQGSRAYLYIGEVQAAWDMSTYQIGTEDTAISFKKTFLPISQINTLNHNKLPRYPNDLYRLVLDGSEIQLVGIVGVAIPLSKDCFSSKKYIAYGSSITANSITYLPQLSYPSLIAKAFGADLFNLGFPGSCRMEEEVATYLAQSIYFDFATVELGINVISEWTIEHFYRQTKSFLHQFLSHHPNIPIFVIDIFTYFHECSHVADDKLLAYREAVEQIIKDLKCQNVHYINGSDLLRTRRNLCADLVHPDIEGHFEIFSHLQEIMVKIV